ncbi:YjiH family protein [Tepidimonas taiwanensis]|uniref:Sporulation integral membrane protein YlbJ n=1 Tax=Tepidimonas taiwanensis TaxID=307486 RepID=A0A554X7W6_9BURK|nr:YjiH family protein [Tepidimonas taiwanensis]MDM7464392.1 YjiH family protein [Tepidimonas taiwanensis]TSE31924.1 sporulation integral membrane protein YlbJ [Tepidimonas taiwanensis]UBQ06303.1 YjiH family protein [Tepidimonas taiwanensis]
MPRPDIALAGSPGGLALPLLKLLAFSAVGVFLFFVDIEIGGRRTIPVDHLSSYLVREQRSLAVAFVLALMAWGAVSPFVTGAFRQSATALVFGVIKLAGLALAGLYLAGLAPDWATQKDMLPFLFEKLALSVGVLIPIGALALSFLVGFGLLELVGVLMERVMRPLFRTPGYSAIDAVTSFVGSYSIGLLVTNAMYQQGKYTVREAMVIATGFSTVSATFMVVVAKTLGLMEHWTFFFWASFVVTFAVTAITAYLPPIAGMDDRRPTPVEDDHAPATGSRWRRALQAGVARYQSREPLPRMLWTHLKDGLQMSAVVTPSILAVGFAGLCLARYTPLFDWIGVLLKPALWIAGAVLGLENATAASGAFASGLAEMFLPAILLKDADFLLRFLVALVSISTVLFLSGCIPCILATRIPVKFRDLLVIWLLRSLLSIVVGAAVLRTGLAFGWIRLPT